MPLECLVTEISKSLFPCPFPVRVSPDAQIARAHDREWQAAVGLVRSAARAAQIDGWRSDLLMARAYPEARGEDLALMTNFVNFAFLFDDQFDGELGQHPDRAAAAVAPFIEIASRPPGAVTAEETPAVRAFQDLWQRLAEPMSIHWQGRFAEQLGEYVHMYAWEATNRACNHVPDLDTYIKGRRGSSAVGLFVLLAERAHRAETPPVIWQDPGFVEMLQITTDYVAWTNDVLAWGREESRHDVHNIVLSIQGTLGHTREQAIARCASMVAEHAERFLQLKGELRGTMRRLGLTPDQARAVDLLVDCGMESWIRANLDWTDLTGRYAERGDESLAEQEDILVPVAPSGAEELVSNSASSGA